MRNTSDDDSTNAPRLMRSHRLFEVFGRVRQASTCATVSMPPGLICNTPILESIPLSEQVGTRVLLKMETMQPSGSFKDRGMAYMCAQLKQSGVSRRVLMVCIKARNDCM